MPSQISTQHVPETVIPLSPKITIFDRTNPRSLINIVWVEFREAMFTVEVNQPELLEMTERKLEKLVEPDPTDCRLRLRFWDEYARAQDRGKRLFLEEICRGVCSTDYFDKHISKNLQKIAWIILPPANYVTTMEELLYKGLDRIREVLDLPLKDQATGRVDTKLIGEMVKIVQMLDQRVKGAIIQKVAIQQRIDQRTQHHFSNDSTDPLLSASTNDLEAIESQLGNLNKRLERWQKPVDDVIELETDEGLREIGPGEFISECQDSGAPTQAKETRDP